MNTIKLSTNDILLITEITKKWDKSTYAYAINAMAKAWTTTFGMLLDYKKTELKQKFFDMIENDFYKISDFTCFKNVMFSYKDVVIVTEQKTEITKEEIKYLVINNNLTLDKLIDVVIDLNGFIGVGLISLGDDLQRYCYSKCK